MRGLRTMAFWSSPSSRSKPPSEDRAVGQQLDLLGQVPDARLAPVERALGVLDHRGDVQKHDGSLSFHSDMPMAPAKPRPAPARRRTRVSSDGDAGGYQLMRWSNAKAGARWSSGSVAGSCLASAASPSGGPTRRFGDGCGRRGGRPRRGRRWPQARSPSTTRRNTRNAAPWRSASRCRK